MVSFCKRPATVLPSTLTFALLCQAGLVAAQSPEGRPYDQNEFVPTAPISQPAPPPPKTPVQQKLDELYKRDGRPLPDYMRTDASPYNGAQQMQPAGTMPYSPAQPPAPPVSPQPMQMGPAPDSQQNIRMQLSDYYAGQGKPMPAPPAWNAADRPQPPVVYYAGQGPQTGSAAPAPPPPRLIDRLNPFSSFWHKDKPSAPNAPPPSGATYSPPPSGAMYAPPPSGATYGNTPAPAPYSQAPYSQAPYSQAPYSQNGGTYWTQPAPPPVRPQTNYAPVIPAPTVMAVELGPNEPIRSMSCPASPAPAMPMRPYSDPEVGAVQPSVVVRSTQAPYAPAPAETVLPPAPPAVAADDTPAEEPRPGASPAAPNVSAKVAKARVEKAPFDRKAELEAETGPAPYTGAKLKDTDDGVSAPDPATVTTANANEPDDRPAVAPQRSVAVEQTTQPNPHPNPQPSVAAPPAATPPPAVVPPSEESGASEEPSVQLVPADSDVPKAFEERQPATELLRGSDESTARMHKIGERVGQRGLKGFCPVLLREQRELVDALPIYSSTFESKRYYFSSAEAKDRFDRSPQKYAPACGGLDVLVKATSDQQIEGSLDFAVWYKDRLFLFSSPESLEAFSLNPVPYAGPFLKAR